MNNNNDYNQQLLDLESSNTDFEAAYRILTEMDALMGAQSVPLSAPILSPDPDPLAENLSTPFPFTDDHDIPHDFQFQPLLNDEESNALGAFFSNIENETAAEIEEGISAGFGLSDLNPYNDPIVKHEEKQMVPHSSLPFGTDESFNSNSHRHHNVSHPTNLIPMRDNNKQQQQDLENFHLNERYIRQAQQKLKELQELQLFSDHASVAQLREPMRNICQPPTNNHNNHNNNDQNYNHNSTSNINDNGNLNLNNLNNQSQQKSQQALYNLHNDNTPPQIHTNRKDLMPNFKRNVISIIPLTQQQSLSQNNQSQSQPQNNIQSQPQPTYKHEQHQRNKSINGNDFNNTASQKRKSKREYLSEDQKRQNHVTSEKKRRTVIKNQFDTLCQLTPSVRAAMTSNNNENGIINDAEREDSTGSFNNNLTNIGNSGTNGIGGKGRYSKCGVLNQVADFMIQLQDSNKKLRKLLEES